tara:strand:+ start:34105 stop:35076 length:972 start_codon:yes stop_codon:yes gene_type:complete
MTAPVYLFGQTNGGANWTAPRTPDGHADLQGIWTNNSATPMQRPEALGDKAVLTDEELAELQQTVQEFRDNEQAGDLLGDRLFQQALGNSKYNDFDTVTGNYNAFWLVERELDNNRTSLIVDPPNGRYPSLTTQEQERAKERRAYASEHPSDGPEDRNLSDRCLHFGAPRLGAGYNSYFHFLQTPGHVTILQEMGHEARVISTDGRSHLDDKLRQWNGQARGWWEGDTFVIETVNFASRSRWMGASENLRMTERYTRVGPDTLKQEVTFDDPTVWTSPWTVEIFMKRTEDPLFEYACHEGNYAMEGILAGARLEEQNTASGSK